MEPESPGQRIQGNPLQATGFGAPHLPGKAVFLVWYVGSCRFVCALCLTPNQTHVHFTQQLQFRSCVFFWWDTVVNFPDYDKAMFTSCAAIP